MVQIPAGLSKILLKKFGAEAVSRADLIIFDSGILRSACKDIVAKMDLHTKINRLSMERAKQDQTQPTASAP
jgi:hypothetical protein